MEPSLFQPVYFALEAVEIYVKRFDGSGGFIEANAFIEDCETMYMHVAPENHQQLLAIIKSKMQWMLPNPNTYSWAELKQILRDAFTQPMDISKWQYMLITCIQSTNENVTKYSDRFSMYHHYLLNACSYGKSPEVIEEIKTLLNIQAIKVFINGLQEPTKGYLQKHIPNTLQCAIELALAEEVYRVPFSYIIYLRCCFCKRNGHLSKNCVENPRLLDACMICNEYGHKTNNCIKKNIDKKEFVPASRRGPQGQSAMSELLCTICCDKTINTALYSCGHMCMCWDCARKHRREASGNCPVCRQPIIDILKVYK